MTITSHSQRWNSTRFNDGLAAHANIPEDEKSVLTVLGVVFGQTETMIARYRADYSSEVIAQKVRARHLFEQHRQTLRKYDDLHVVASNILAQWFPEMFLEEALDILRRNRLQPDSDACGYLGPAQSQAQEIVARVGRALSQD
jgi:hypothetical protein